MTVDEDRKLTAPDRRRTIIRSLSDGFALTEDSYIGRFKALVDAGPRVIVANADIDGLVSAQMLSAATGWRIGALFDRDGSLKVESSLGDPATLLDNHELYGVDLFSPLYPSMSNHPLYFGASARTHKSVRDELLAFDADMASEVVALGAFNLSAWAGVGAMLGSDKPNGMPYKYPLGTAQLTLAVLERAGFNPTLYDRQYLPWLIANCDGGVDTIRTYAWNAETWWSALAASVGPSSHSEALYQLVINQRPSQFLDADRRLRYEDPERAEYLSTKWNLAGDAFPAMAAISSLITDLSGWPDPFLNGVQNLQTWKGIAPTRNLLRISGITGVPSDHLKLHLDMARVSGHMNFSKFKERGVGLGWALMNVDDSVAEVLGVEDLHEEIAEDQPTIPDLNVDDPSGGT